MRKKIRGLIAMVILLICFSVPAAAATESFHFEQKTASVQVGKTKELSVYNNGRKVDPKKVQWKSSNPKLAAISNGKVTAKSWGNVQIYAVYGGKKISCKVYTYNQLIYTDFTGLIAVNIGFIISTSQVRNLIVGVRHTERQSQACH